MKFKDVKNWIKKHKVELIVYGTAGIIGSFVMQNFIKNE